MSDIQWRMQGPPFGHQPVTSHPRGGRLEGILGVQNPIRPYSSANALTLHCDEELPEDDEEVK